MGEEVRMIDFDANGVDDEETTANVAITAFVDEDERVLKWEVGLANCDDLTPLCQSLIPPEVASAFSISPEPRRTALDVDRASKNTVSSLRPIGDHSSNNKNRIRSFNDAAVVVEIWNGRFEILCLSGSYLLAEDGGPHSRTGGISASLSTPDGHVIVSRAHTRTVTIGGGVATLIASSIIQLVVCSFIYGGSKPKNKQLASPKGKDSEPQHCSESTVPTSAPSTEHISPPMSVWPVGLRNLHADIDLMRG